MSWISAFGRSVSELRVTTSDSCFQQEGKTAFVSLGEIADLDG